MNKMDVSIGVEEAFIDDGLIDSVQCLSRKINTVKNCRAPVLVKDQPWEKNLYLTCNTWSVVKDENGQFKCWYEDWHLDHAAFREANMAGALFSKTSRIKSILSPEISTHRVLYACSKDGVRWEKPRIDTVSGEDRTNIVFGSPSYGNVHAPCVFVDPAESDPSKKYKMICTHYSADEESSHGRVTIAESGDGVNWVPCETSPVFGASGSRLGDVWTMFYDESIGRYLMPTRHINMHSYGMKGMKPGTLRLKSFFAPYFPNDRDLMNKRRVSLCMSDNLFSWNEPFEIVVPDPEKDNLDDSFYGMQITKVGSVYLGFLHVLQKVENTMKVVLCFSRDLKTWKRVAAPGDFIAPSGNGNWDAYMVNMPSLPIHDGDKTLVFYGGASCHHDYWMTGPSGRESLDIPEATDPSLCRFGLGVSEIGRNRYVSLSAGIREGLLTTNVLHCKEPFNSLKINGCCRDGGFVRAEITDAEHNVFEEFRGEDCSPLLSDDVAHSMDWRHETEISASAFRIRFYIKNADLYSFSLCQKGGKGG